MGKPKKHSNESSRLELLKTYSILDTMQEADYDNLTMLAAQICNTPISLVTLVDSERQWFKSRHGLDVQETPRDYAFCAHAINGTGGIFEVEDSRKDERFDCNPLVEGEPRVVFYAGVPLTGPEGLPLGTLCVIDHKPGKLTENQINALDILSAQVMNLLELRRKKIELEDSNRSLDRKNDELEKFAFLAAHDLKSPLKNISALTDILQTDYTRNMDSKGKKVISMLRKSADMLDRLITGIYDHSRSAGPAQNEIHKINLKTLVQRLDALFGAFGKLSITSQSEKKYLYTNRSALERIFVNLISNAINHNDKEHTEIHLKLIEKETEYEMAVSDNGPGIAKENWAKIFGLFYTLPARAGNAEHGTGIGLATVKKTVENLGGRIWLESDIGKGTTFRFTLKRL